jgi:hypothetical protein
VADPDDPAVKKLKELTSQLDKARAAGKVAVKEVTSARKKAASATKLVKTAVRRQQAPKRASKKR